MNRRSFVGAVIGIFMSGAVLRGEPILPKKDGLTPMEFIKALAKEDFESWRGSLIVDGQHYSVGNPQKVEVSNELIRFKWEKIIIKREMRILAFCLITPQGHISKKTNTSLTLHPGEVLTLDQDIELKWS